MDNTKSFSKKILHISFADTRGGAAIAAFRHHEAMLKAGIDSKMLVIEKGGDDNNVIKYKIPLINRFIRKIFNKLFHKYYNFHASWSYNHFGYNLEQDKYVKDADVIYLHWINNYSISISSIENILKSGKHVYWFMHDMWPITGGCHYSLHCDKYISHCESCPMLHKLKGSHKINDISYRQYEEKRTLLVKYDNLVFLTPSEWLAEKVRVSGLFRKHTIMVSRNVLNTDIFTIRDKRHSRQKLNLPLDKKLILFGADNISSPYKGWSILKEALKTKIENAVCVLYGTCDVDVQSEIGLKVYSLGKISDIDTLVDLYNACDVFVTPSLADNYPNVLLEAMACGLPAVASNIGGIPDIVKNNFNGILVNPLSVADFRKSIIDILNGEIKLDSSAIRDEIVKNNSYLRVKQQHKFLFE